MREFLHQCVERYQELAGPKAPRITKAHTPFCSPAQLAAVEGIPGEGALASIAARVLMKVLYAARICRPDLLFAVSMMARRVHSWDASCDMQLHRLMCYVHTTKHLVQRSFVGDHLHECTLVLCTDSDFAADTEDAKSTSGIFLCILGPNTMVPLTYISKSKGPSRIPQRRPK